MAIGVEKEFKFFYLQGNHSVDDFVIAFIMKKCSYMLFYAIGHLIFNSMTAYTQNSCKTTKLAHDLGTCRCHLILKTLKKQNRHGQSKNH